MTKEQQKLENHKLSFQSLSEILRILKKLWHEMRQNLYWPSKIEGTSLKFENQKRFLFRPIYVHMSIQGKEHHKISCDSPFKYLKTGLYVEYISVSTVTSLK